MKHHVTSTISSTILYDSQNTFTCTVCPTRYRGRHFFNNSNTNEDIATKFEQEYVRCVRNEEECVCSRCNILISGKIIKEMTGSVASGTPYLSPRNTPVSMMLQFFHTFSSVYLLVYPHTYCPNNVALLTQPHLFSTFPILFSCNLIHRVTVLLSLFPHLHLQG